MTRGTANVPAEQFKQLDSPLSFHSKKNNILGFDFDQVKNIAGLF
jgi:hypothetical protein